MRGRAGAWGAELLGLARLASNSLTDSPSLSPSDFSWENMASQLPENEVGDGGDQREKRVPFLLTFASARRLPSECSSHQPDYG